MRTRWLWLCVLSLIFVVPTLAQDTTPPAALDAATTAIQNALNTDERPSNWSFTLLPTTGNTNLGCLSVSGTETGLNFTPYRLSLTFSTGTYIVHTLADGSRAVICDPQLAGEQPTPDPNDPLANECTANPVATLPVYTQPSTDFPLLGNLQAGTDYLVVAQSNPFGWFQVTFNNSSGWVEATSVTLSSACTSNNIPVLAFVVPEYTSPDCFVTPASTFSNMRNAPSTENSQVLFELFENTLLQVTGISPDGQWWFTPYGWIADSVALTFGDCQTQMGTVNEGGQFPPFPGTQPTDDTETPPSTSVIDTNVQSALNQFACPAEYAGYMQPRIGLGNANAAIEQGGIPNTLRAFPTVDDNVGTRLGTIQPGRTLDRVISGPVCNQGFVWWYVEVDGAQGWTAESNAADNSYFITPIGTQTVPAATGGQAPSGQTPTTSSGGIPTIGSAPVRNGTEPVIGIAMPPSRTAYFATFQTGFGDAQSTTIADFDLVMAIGGNAVTTVQAAAIGLGYSANLNAIVVPTETGAIFTYNPTTNDLIARLTLASNAEASAFAVDDLGRFAWGDCTDASCAFPTIGLYDLNSRAEVWLKSTSASVEGIAISASGLLVASGNSDGAVQIWDGSNGALNATFQETNQVVLAGDVVYTDLAFNPADDNQLLVSGCNVRDLQGVCTQGRVGLVNTSDGSLIGIVPQFDNEVTDIVYYNNGSRFISTDGKTIIVANAATGSTLAEWDFQFTEDVDIISMAVAEDDTRLLVGTNNGMVILLNLTAVTG